MNSVLQQVFVNLVALFSWLTTSVRYKTKVPNPHEVRSILVFQLTELGDVAIATAALSQLRRHFKQARLILVCGGWAKPMMEGQPCIDQVLVYQSNLAMTSKRAHLSPSEHWRLVREMAKLPVDLIVDLRGNLGSVLVAWLSSARFRADRGTIRWRDFLSKSNTWDRHETVINQHIIELLGVPSDKPTLTLSPVKGGEIPLNQKLSEFGLDQLAPFVILHPGASWIGKRWREERFAELADKIRNEVGLQVVLTGSKAEEGIGLDVLRYANSEIVNLIGKLDLRELLSVYAKARLWIGNDTGTMHVAVALGIPVIVLWGPTKVSKFGPCGDNAIVIQGHGEIGCPDDPRAKMDLIQVSDVWRVVSPCVSQSC